MTDRLADMRAKAEEIQALVEGGMDLVPHRLAQARLITPLLQLIDAMETDKASLRWRTLSEAMNESGMSRNWFEKPLASLGGSSRLEAWRNEGLADRTPENLWLISPSRVPPKAERKAARRKAPSRKPKLAPDAAALADALTN